MTPVKLESSILITAVIQCNKCAKIDASEEWSNNIPEAAKGFYEDGWREINGIVYCGNCVEILKRKP